MSHPQDEVYQASIESPETFWAEQAAHLHWHKQPTSILRKYTKTIHQAASFSSSSSRGEQEKEPEEQQQQQQPTTGRKISHDHWEWFADGEISTCYNAVDRHVLAGRGDAPAIYYDSPVTGGTKQCLTYGELLREVDVFAGVLREEGVGKGDVVLVYMPMIPAVLIGLLAISRLGALHTVVFGGFAPHALAQRIQSSRPKAILTASCGLDGTKPPIPYRELVVEAGRLASATWTTPRTLVWQREEEMGGQEGGQGGGGEAKRLLPTWHPLRRERGERNWNRLVRSALLRRRQRQPGGSGTKEKGEGWAVGVECVPFRSSDPAYIIYTSGTTGLPKGVVRDAGGHAVGLVTSMRHMFGITGPGDVMACLSDIGWVVGHSFTLYGPLLVGAATVLYEGKPVGTPDAGAFWRLVQTYRVNALFTAPTALRAIRKDDPAHGHLRRVGEAGGLRSLRALFLAGERSEPAIVSMYQALLGQYGPQGATVVDNWWSSESGAPISGISLAPENALARSQQHGDKDKDKDKNKNMSKASSPLPIKPGSAGKPMPGFDVRVVDDEGNEVGRGEMGNIVLKMPLAPTAFRTLWEDDERFYKGYLKRFGGRWLDTGDAGIVDLDGYVHIMARSDDIINVAAHRLSTGTLEQAITSHPRVTEACVVGIPDALKGQLPFAFVVTSSCSNENDDDDDGVLLGEIQTLVRQQVGAIATLGGLLRSSDPAASIIPKTRSGKTLRRVLRELLENGVHGEVDKTVGVPSTVEDAGVVENAREAVRRYFEGLGEGVHRAIEARAKL